MTKIKLGKNNKVRIDWHVHSMDYSHEAEENIIEKFRAKYGLRKEQITINPLPYKENNGEQTDIDNNVSYNIQQPEFQHNLFKQYIKERGVTDYNFDTILKIDSDINDRVDYSLYEPNKRYFIKWIKWDNFMSYGTGNRFDFTGLNGLVLLSSDPANQGGKTTFCLDLIRFLLFGKVTSRESDWTLAKVFNKYIPEATSVVVEGCITIDGVDYVIKRTVSRPALNKRSDKSKVAQKVDYYKIVNSEYIDLYDEECENGHGTKETNKIIKDTIGNESDFDLMICVDSDNLKGLISLKDTERGKLISRWIGLIILQKKDEVARKLYNEEVSKSMTISRYNKEALKNEINDLQSSIKTMTEENKANQVKAEKTAENIKKLKQDRDVEIAQKKTIEPTLTQVDVPTLEQKIKTITENGLIKKSQLEQQKEILGGIKAGEFNLDEYNGLKKEEQSVNEELLSARVKFKSIDAEIATLKSGEYCPTCGAKLKNVDNTAKIAAKEKERENLKDAGVKLSEKKKILSEKILKIEETKAEVEKKDKTELIIAKIGVDLANLRNEYNEAVGLMKQIEESKQIIEKNNEIDSKIRILDESIKVEEGVLDRLKEQMTFNKFSIEKNNESIKKNEELIKKIEEEEVLITNWRLYLEMIGKNGITKLVVRSVLPQINVELKQLLSDICDFDVEVSMDEHNDVEFLITHDGVKSNLSSGSGFEQTVASLALRTVLSKISNFSKPSFVVFDEILGGVAAENYDPVKRLYDKILTQYKCILFITHNTAHKEWADRTITVKKRDNISTIYLE